MQSHTHTPDPMPSGREVKVGSIYVANQRWVVLYLVPHSATGRRCQTSIRTLVNLPTSAHTHTHEHDLSASASALVAALGFMQIVVLIDDSLNTLSDLQPPLWWDL